MAKKFTLLAVIPFILVLLTNHVYLGFASEIGDGNLETFNKAIKDFLTSKMKSYSKWLSFRDPFGPNLATTQFTFPHMDLKISNQFVDGHSKTTEVKIDVYSDIKSNAFELYYFSGYERYLTLKGEYQVNGSGFGIIGVHASHIDVPFCGKGNFVFKLNKTYESIYIRGFTIDEHDKIDISHADIDYKYVMIDGENKLNGIELGEYDTSKYKNSTVLIEYIEYMLMQNYQMILAGYWDEPIFPPTKILLMNYIQMIFKKYKLSVVIPEWQPDLLTSKINREKVFFNNKTVVSTRPPSSAPRERVFKSNVLFPERQDGQSLLKPYFKIKSKSIQKYACENDAALKNFLIDIMGNYTVWLGIHDSQNRTWDSFEYNYDHQNVSMHLEISNQSIDGFSKTTSEIIGAFSDMSSGLLEITLTSYHGRFAFLSGSYKVNFSGNSLEQFQGEGKFGLKVKSSKQKLLLNGFNITDDGYIDIVLAEMHHEYFILDGDNDLYWTKYTQYESTSNGKMNLDNIEKSLVHVMHLFLAGLDNKRSVSLPKVMLIEYLKSKFAEHKLKDITDNWKQEPPVFSSSKHKFCAGTWGLVVLEATVLATFSINS